MFATCRVLAAEAGTTEGLGEELELKRRTAAKHFCQNSSRASDLHMYRQSAKRETCFLESEDSANSGSERADAKHEAQQGNSNPLLPMKI